MSGPQAEGVSRGLVSVPVSWWAGKGRSWCQDHHFLPLTRDFTTQSAHSSSLFLAPFLLSLLSYSFFLSSLLSDTRSRSLNHGLTCLPT